MQVAPLSLCILRIWGKDSLETRVIMQTTWHIVYGLIYLRISYLTCPAPIRNPRSYLSVILEAERTPKQPPSLSGANHRASEN
jgi:hypothetical protein